MSAHLLPRSVLRLQVCELCLRELFSFFTTASLASSRVCGTPQTLHRERRMLSELKLAQTLAGHCQPPVMWGPLIAHPPLTTLQRTAVRSTCLLLRLCCLITNYDAAGADADQATASPAKRQARFDETTESRQGALKPSCANDFRIFSTLVIVFQSAAAANLEHRRVMTAARKQ